MCGGRGIHSLAGLAIVSLMGPTEEGDEGEGGEERRTEAASETRRWRMEFAAEETEVRMVAWMYSERGAKVESTKEMARCLACACEEGMRARDSSQNCVSVFVGESKRSALAFAIVAKTCRRLRRCAKKSQ